MQSYLPSFFSSPYLSEGPPLSDAKVGQENLDELLQAFIQSPTQLAGCFTCQSEHVFRNGLDLDLSVNRHINET